MMDVNSWRFFVLWMAIHICTGPPRAPVDPLSVDTPAITAEAC